jgi:hypothetical protein
MLSGKTVLAQLMEFVPKRSFHTCVRRYRGHYKIKSFSCWDQFLCLVFAQLTYRESLRDIEVCLRSLSNRLYHCGFRGRISRSTMADANERRDWRIFADFGQLLIDQARALYRDDHFSEELKETVYALDSTTIDLCLKLFPWAPYVKGRGAVKLHTLLDLRGSIPTSLWVTHGRVNDVRILDKLTPEPGSYYILDRGYISFKRLYRLDQERAYFIVRARKNQQFRRLTSRPVDQTTNLRCDQTIALTGVHTPFWYPAPLRRVAVFDPEKKRILNLFTNNFKLPAPMVADLYRCRWQVELFFRWIKQHLRIKSFFGRSENAVKTQIWVAVTVYVLVAIIKKRLNIDISLYTILQVLSVNPLSQTPLYQLLTESAKQNVEMTDHKQLILFE